MWHFSTVIDDRDIEEALAEAHYEHMVLDVVKAFKSKGIDKVLSDILLKWLDTKD